MLNVVKMLSKCISQTPVNEIVNKIMLLLDLKLQETNLRLWCEISKEPGITWIYATYLIFSVYNILLHNILVI